MLVACSVQQTATADQELLEQTQAAEGVTFWIESRGSRIQVQAIPSTWFTFALLAMVN